MSAVDDPRRVLRRHGLSPKQSWGQNFLVDRRAIGAIVEAANVGPHDRVIEIGAGLGTLTRALGETGARVVAIERDRDLCAVLRFELADLGRVEIAETNALDYPFLEHPGAVVVGNLPYQLSGALLRRLLDAAHRLKRMVVLIQREVALRLVARPGTREYGILAVLTAAAGRARVVVRLRPGAFHPAPRVHSSVVVIEPAAGGPLDPRLAMTVHAAFHGKRKILRNSLLDAAIATPEAIDRALLTARLDPRTRAETLPLEAFRRLSEALHGSS